MGAIELGHLRVEGFADVVKLFGGGTAGSSGEQFFEFHRRLGQLIGDGLSCGGFGRGRGIENFLDGGDAGAIEAAIAIEKCYKAGDDQEIDCESQTQDVENFFHNWPFIAASFNCDSPSWRNASCMPMSSSSSISWRCCWDCQRSSWRSRSFSMIFRCLAASARAARASSIWRCTRAIFWAMARALRCTEPVNRRW